MIHYLVFTFLALPINPEVPDVPSLDPLVAVLIGAAAGILTAGTAAFGTIRKLKSEINHTEAESESSRATAAETIVNAAKSLVDPLVARLEAAEAAGAANQLRITQLDHRVDELEAHIDRLEEIMRQASVSFPARP